jgi:hypothetical protein
MFVALERYVYSIVTTAAAVNDSMPSTAANYAGGTQINCRSALAREIGGEFAKSLSRVPISAANPPKPRHACRRLRGQARSYNGFSSRWSDVCIPA